MIGTIGKSFWALRDFSGSSLGDADAGQGYQEGWEVLVGECLKPFSRSQAPGSWI